MTKFDVDADMVRKLAGLLKETGMNEIEYAEGEQRIRLMRSPPVMQGVAGGPAIQVPAGETVSSPPAPTAPSGHANAVTSPMVGTVYLSPDPGGPPFVKVGDRVKPGDTLLIVEAMKVMNPIKATITGIVKEIFVGDAMPVEFGEALMIIA
ncbi:MAG: acetyl-CoA carboxylase biotin carboxyl carrier protein [Alphaproteobacteria bacterium]